MYEMNINMIPDITGQKMGQKRHDKTRLAMLKKIRQYGHMLNDIKLYLDTHPNCQKALAAYEKYRKNYDMITYEYNLRYSPITASLSEQKRWDWLDEPWPWENEANEM